jgi:metallo-beta-lactamase family protein
MVDCGLFQGLKALRQLNWEPLTVDVAGIDMVLLTHGHLDHTGYLPSLVANGFKGPILGTPPTLAIAGIILRDTAKIQEEEADEANREGYSKHQPALPLYTLEDAEKAIASFSVREKDLWITLSKHIRCRFNHNGHIIGASFIELEIFGKLFVFSGDVGRSQDLLLKIPDRPRWADYLFVESTYGNKLHPEEDVEAYISGLVRRTVHERGTLIIPSFAVERLQSLMYVLWKLYRKNNIPNIPIIVDSPMGKNVLTVFEEFKTWHKLPLNDYHAMCNHMQITSSYKETWETIDDPRPKIVIAGSGMVTGGRVLTYLKYLLDQTSTTVLLVGYMGEGTRGRQLLEGASELKLFGKYYEVKARIEHLESLSAHADQKELLDWMSGIKNIPEAVYLIHGEPTALDAFRSKIRDYFGWNAHIPQLQETITLMC